MKRTIKTIIVVCISMIGIIVISLSVLAFPTNVPLPLDSPPGMEYKIPENLPGKTGGPFIMKDDVVKIAEKVSNSKGEAAPRILEMVLTTHQALIDEEIFSPSYSVAGNREVYLIILEGEFTFNRVRYGLEPIQSKLINIEIDATTGDVLAVGTSPLTLNPELWERLAIVSNN